MARVDKTDSAVGVVRGLWASDVATSDLNRVIGVGFDANGNLAKGGGTTGIVGVSIPTRVNRRAGEANDAFVLAEILFDEGEELATGVAQAAGVKVYMTPAGVLSLTATGNTQIGFMAERDRLVVRL